MVGTRAKLIGGHESQKASLNTENFGDFCHIHTYLPKKNKKFNSNLATNAIFPLLDHINRANVDKSSS